MTRKATQGPRRLEVWGGCEHEGLSQSGCRLGSKPIPGGGRGQRLHGDPRRGYGGSPAETSFQSRATYSTLPHVSGAPVVGGGSKLRETPDSRGNDATRRGGKNDRLVGGDLRGVKSVPRGAGDEEAHVIQRPPGAGLRLGPLRALGRRRLGLRRLRSALAAAQLSAHGLQEERPVRRWASRTPPSPRPAPARPSPQDAGRSWSGVPQRLPPCSARPRRDVEKG